jgi:hypothetical protein
MVPQLGERVMLLIVALDHSRNGRQQPWLVDFLYHVVRPIHCQISVSVIRLTGLEFSKFLYSVARVVGVIRITRYRLVFQLLESYLLLILIYTAFRNVLRFLNLVDVVFGDISHFRLIRAYSVPHRL